MRFVLTIVSILTLGFISPAMADVEIRNLEGELLHTVVGQDNLIGVDLSGLNLIEADLDGETITSCTCVDVNFRGADLSNTNFRFSDLSDTNFNEANLSGANLNDTIAQAGTLRNTNLSSATMRRADFQRSKFIGANMDGLIGTDANLSESIMRSNDNDPPVSTIATNMNLNDANLAGVNFRNTDLSNSTLRRTILTGATLNNANLTGVNFQGADITNLTLRNATITATTSFQGADVIVTRSADDNSNSEDLRKLYKAMDEAGDLANFPAVWDNFFSARTVLEEE